MLRQFTQTYVFILFFLLILLFLVSYLHITNGVYDMTVIEVIKTLLRIESNPKFELVVFEFRLPRIIIAGLVGVGLAIAGVVLQGITRNGLADPGILGINAGAGSSIVLFMFFFQFSAVNADISSIFSILTMPIFGFVGGLLAAFIIFVFAMKNGYLDMQRLILTGIAINSGFGALTMYFSLKMNAKDYESAAVWLNGTIYNANWVFVWAMLPWLILFGLYIFKKSYLLDYFQLEENTIKSLGIELEKEKIKMLIVSVGIISACVSVSGSIGFIGLMAPHIARQLVGVHHRQLMLVSVLVGAVLLIFADFIGKSIFAPLELSAGVVVSIIGIPYFIYLLIKTKS